MAAEVLDGETVKRWCRLSVDALGQTGAAIDALNVFPVPDADTGTNLHITLMSAAEAVESLPAGAGTTEVWHAAARGALLGACGNSGIIVSQLLRGLADVCAPEPRCDGAIVARALAHAAASARAAVSRPAEGTVLTVADAAALAGAGLSGDHATLAAVVTAAAAAAREALAATRNQLDVLAASGVVDAGAAGLCVLLDALAAVITGARPDAFAVPAAPAAPAVAAGPPAAPAVAAGPPAAPGAPAAAAARRSAEPGPGDFGYEVTYLLEAPPEAVGVLRERLDSLGDSLVIAGGGDVWNVHVHVADAGAAIEAGLNTGRPRRITVTWLAASAAHNGPGADHAARGHGVVAVAASDGLAALLCGAGARVLRQQDRGAPAIPALIETIRQSGPRVAFIPDTDHVARLARAAAGRLGADGFEVSVITARSPLQGLAALAVHDPGRAFAADVAAMNRAAAGMRFGSVTGPGPDGGFTGLAGEEVKVIAAAQNEAAAALAAMLLSAGGELVTLMEGAGAEPGLARFAADGIGRDFPAAEVVCYEGGPVPLLIGVE